MRKATMVVVVAWMAAGCAKESPVKYDPVKDSSSIHETIRGTRPGQSEPDLPAIDLLLTGEGKRPEKWVAALFVTHRNPKGEPDFWGESPTFAIAPDSPFENVFKVSRMIDSKAERTPWDDQVMFGMQLEDLIRLIDQGGRFALNGKPFTLTEGEQGIIRQAIIAAREDTNSGE